MNVTLLPHTPDHLRALLAGPGDYEARFGVAVAEGLQEFLAGPDVSESFHEYLRKSAGADPWRDGFGVLLREENKVIGFASFNGPPDAEGMVEISYAIAPGCRGRGYATEAARLLIERAMASGKVRTLFAHTLPEKNASTRILEKCGFQLGGEVMSQEDGLIWRWELPLADSEAAHS